MNKTDKDNRILINEPSEEIFNSLENNDDIGNYVLDEDATTTEKIKYELCDVIFDFRDKYNLSNQELAKRLEISELKAHQILYHQYDKFTFDELINHAEKLLASEKAKLFTYHHSVMVTSEEENQQYEVITQ